MEKPPYLKEGDGVAIVATARKVSESEMQPAIRLFESWGLKVFLGDHLYASSNQFAGTSQQRVSDFQCALDDKKISAIVCARGGYGTVKIIDELDFNAFQKNPKWIVGYSDITVLHSHIQQNYGIQTLHAEMPINYSEANTESITSLKQALFGNRLSYTFKPHLSNREGQIKGTLVGGNLSILYSLIGTRSSLDTEKKVLFIEDLDEYLYHLDRMIINMKRANMLAHLGGLVVGGLTEMNDNTIPYGQTPEQIIRNAIEEYDFPVGFGFNAGHTNPNLALKLGAQVELNIEKDQCQLSISS